MLTFSRLCNYQVILPGIFFLVSVATNAAPAAWEPVSPNIVAQLKAMNEADCTSSKRGDIDAFAKTLAPEYKGINADATIEDRETLIAEMNKEGSQTKVTSCSTTVRKVTRKGEQYFLYGVYREAGLGGPKQTPYRIREQIRDTWRKSENSWLQTESLSYDMTLQVGGKTKHTVLPKDFRAQ